MHESVLLGGCGSRGVGRIAALVATVALSLLPSPSSAQIISTSIPRLETAGAPGEEKKFAIHLMASPFSKWHYNEIVAGNIGDSEFFDVGLFSGTPNSDFLFAGEGVFKLGSTISIGVGGWYNKVGRVAYDFSVNTFDFDGFFIDHSTGTLTGDLKLSEGHVSVFFKDVGVQAGLVHTRSTLLDSVIITSTDLPTTVGGPLGSIEVGGADSSATDWDLYGVYKYAGQTARPFGISVGAGVYNKKGSTETSQRAPEDQMVFSGFVTGSVDVYKGLGLDVSYWYIAKTEADLGLGEVISSEEAASRFTVGIGYSFSR